MQITQKQRRQIRRLVRESLMERKILLEQRALMIEEIDVLSTELNNKGYTPKMIEEGILDLFGGGLVKGMKQNIIEWIADACGIERKSVVMIFLINFIEEFNIFGLGKYFDEGKCKEIPALVARAGLETLTEIEGRKLLELLYFAVSGTERIDDPELFKRFDTGMGSLVKAAGREIVNEVIYSFIGPIIEPRIEAIFCKYNGVGDFLKRGVYAGEAKEDLKSLTKTGAGVAATEIGVDAGIDTATKALQKRDDEKRKGSGEDLARQIMGDEEEPEKEE